MGKYVTAKFEKRDVVMARLNALLPTVGQELAIIQLEGAEQIADTAAAFAPVATGRYRASIHGDLLANNPGKGKRSPVATQTKDPNATGVYANYIWRFLEFGTVNMGAQPHIMPAYRAKRKLIRRRMHNAVSRAVRKVFRGTP